MGIIILIGNRDGIVIVLRARERDGDGDNDKGVGIRIMIYHADGKDATRWAVC